MSEIQQKTGRRLILADGMTIENGRCGYSDGHLWCWIAGYSMQNAALIFFDSNKTYRIVYEYGEMSDTYENFTVCTNMMVDNDGMVSVCLTRGDANV